MFYFHHLPFVSFSLFPVLFVEKVKKKIEKQKQIRKKDRKKEKEIFSGIFLLLILQVQKDKIVKFKKVTPYFNTSTRIASKRRTRKDKSTKRSILIFPIPSREV